MKNIFLDIETIPAQPEEAVKAAIAQGISAPNTMKKSETISDWHNGVGKYAGDKDKAIEKKYRDTSFNAALGEICSISWGNDEETFSSTAADTNGMSESLLLEKFFNHILELSTRNLHTEPPMFVGHYVAGFDLKFIWRRAVILGIKPPFGLKFNGYHNKDFYCTQAAWCGYKETVSMAALAEAFGIEAKGEMDGSKVWDEWKAGNFDKVEAYNRSDVDAVREIHKRLTFGGK